MIKQSTIDGIRRYADHHIQTGDFLYAVLTNNLIEACQRADEENIKVLPEIVKYCYNEIPHICWGSPKKVRDWLYTKKGGQDNDT